MVVLGADSDDYLSVFTSHVPSAFLDKLDNPAVIPPQGAVMDIREQRLAYKPWETFAFRLVAAIWDITCGTRGDDEDNSNGNDWGSSKAESAEGGN